MASLDTYILDENNNPQQVGDAAETSKWWTTNFHSRCVVGKTQVGTMRVSTVFLMFDHNFNDQGPPVLFETMVFGTDEEICRRYCTWDEAKKGHDEIVQQVKVAPTD